MTRVTLAAEGLLDIAVLRRLATDAGLRPGDAYGMKGKGHLDQKLGAYNRAAEFAPWIVLRDLDTDASCPGELRTQLLSTPSRHMQLRVVVHEIEAWLMADHQTFSQSFSVSLAKLPEYPELVLTPKSELLSLLVRSQSRVVREGMVRKGKDGNLSVGAEYGAQLRSYVQDTWRPNIAAQVAPSLEKAIARISSLTNRPYN